ncbi:MAG: squalene/phytoene synthase family protein [Pirellulales bacterium]|nr:squalene/phytoene synthase family protein [Pirellulales bacterium]
MSQIDTAYNHCSDYTRQHAANFFYAFKHLDTHRRRGIHALYAFCQYADSIVDGEAPLEEKRESLARLITALSADTTETTEPEYAWLLPALRDTIERFQLPFLHFRSFLDGIAIDLTQSEFETFAQLRDYAWKVASVVGLLSIEIFGYRHESVRTYAGQLGLALQLTNIIRDVGPDAAQNRIYLPREDRDRFGVSREDILSGKTSDGYRALMRFEAERAEGFYVATRNLLRDEDRRTMLPSEIMKNIYHRLLQKIRRQDFPLSENVIHLSHGTKLWIALRTRMSWPRLSR